MPKEFLEFMNERSCEHMRMIVREIVTAIDDGTIIASGKSFEDGAEAFAAAALICGVEEELIDELAIRTARGRRMFERMKKH